LSAVSQCLASKPRFAAVFGVMIYEFDWFLTVNRIVEVYHHYGHRKSDQITLPQIAWHSIRQISADDPVSAKASWFTAEVR
jgi:hypothetical protein